MINNSEINLVSVAYQVLAHARRSMHYSQIASVAQEFGLIPAADSTTIHSLSSLLIWQTKRNPQGPIVKERSGIYSLLDNSPYAEMPTNVGYAALQPSVDRLRNRTGIPDFGNLENKSLYLLRRILDIAHHSNTVSLRNLVSNISIDIDTIELIQAFIGSSGEQLPLRPTYHMSPRLTELTVRLGSCNPTDCLQLAFFLLDLALDVSDTNNVISIEGPTTSIRFAVRAELNHASLGT